MRLPIAFLVLAGCLCAAQAGALTVDQVIDLRKAGVSNQTIQIMIENEQKVQAEGGVGRYVIKSKGGQETIVYRASSPRGVVEYPVDSLPQGRVSEQAAVILGGPKRVGAKAKPAPKPKAAKPKKAQKSGGYSLLFASFRKMDNARTQQQELKAQGVDASIVTVDLPGKGRWHRVVSGAFSARGQARAKGEELKRAGKLKSYLVLGP